MVKCQNRELYGKWKFKGPDTRYCNCSESCGLKIFKVLNNWDLKNTVPKIRQLDTFSCFLPAVFCCALMVLSGVRCIPSHPTFRLGVATLPSVMILLPKWWTRSYFDDFEN